MPKYVKYPKPGSRKSPVKNPPNIVELNAFCRHLTSLGYSTSAKWLRKKLGNLIKALEAQKATSKALREELNELRKEYLGLHKIED